MESNPYRLAYKINQVVLQTLEKITHFFLAPIKSRLDEVSNYVLCVSLLCE